MTDQIREQISALLDGELAAGEIGLLVRRMERDPELRRAFGNYVLAGECLRGPGAMASPAFASRVSAALDAGAPVVRGEPAHRGPAAGRWKRPLAGVAVAAGAALAAVLLVRPDPGADGFVADGTAPAPAPAVVVAMPHGGASPTPAQNQRLAGFLVAHGQYATPIGRRTAWSNALATDPGISRVVYEDNEQRR